MLLEKNKYKLVYSVKTDKIYKSGLIYNYSNYGDLKEADLKKYLARQWKVFEDNIFINDVEKLDD